MGEQPAGDVQRAELFSVPMWTAAVEPKTAWINDLVTDIDALLDTGDLDFSESAGNQTLPNLQERQEPHWGEFFKFVGSAFEEIARTAPQLRWPHHGLRSWGLRVDQASSAKDLRQGPGRTLLTHNHAPALLTSVFTCELPDLPAAQELSTVFYNPVAHAVCPWQERVALVSPKVGVLTVFPGWIEHAAPLVVPLASGQRRVIISTDYFPEVLPVP